MVRTDLPNRGVVHFHFWPSLCSQKVRLALEEKGVAYEGRLVSIGPAMENYEPDYVMAPIIARLALPRLLAASLVLGLVIAAVWLALA